MGENALKTTPVCDIITISENLSPTPDTAKEAEAILIPHLHFNGDCRQTHALYEPALHTATV